MREKTATDLLLETRILSGWQREKKFSMFRVMIQHWDVGWGKETNINEVYVP
jgi:hypothetical protein